MTRGMFPCTIIGKTTEQRGWIFKETVYILAIQFERTGHTTQREVSFGTYASMEVGSKHEVAMYSTDDAHWYFSEDEAGFNIITG